MPYKIKLVKEILGFLVSHILFLVPFCTTAHGSNDSRIVTNLTVVTPVLNQTIISGTNITFRYTSPISIGSGMAEVYKGATLISTTTSASPSTDKLISTNNFSQAQITGLKFMMQEILLSLVGVIILQ
jgi:hypothetical protein